MACSLLESKAFGRAAWPAMSARAGSSAGSAAGKVRVLGIDPGSRITGYGLIEARGGELRYLASGRIRAGRGPIPARLGQICQGVTELIRSQGADVLAIEVVFLARNPQSALKLGQARGAAIAAGVQAGLEVFEYAARTVKKTVVGTGRANKPQVQHMVRALLRLPGPPTADAADALAIAICHVNTAAQRNLHGKGPAKWPAAS